MLEIERGRQTRAITPLHRRLCPSCNEIEDEKHFVLDCPIYRDERVKLYDKIHTVNPTFVEMVPDSKFIFLFTSNHRQIINWFGQFIYVCFEKRSKLDRGLILRKVNWLNVAQYWPVCTHEICQCVFELYNHPAISLVNVIYDVYMRICDASQIRVLYKHVRLPSSSSSSSP